MHRRRLVSVFPAPGPEYEEERKSEVDGKRVTVPAVWKPPAKESPFSSGLSSRCCGSRRHRRRKHGVHRQHRGGGGTQQPPASKSVSGVRPSGSFSPSAFVRWEWEDIFLVTHPQPAPGFSLVFFCSAYLLFVCLFCFYYVYFFLLLIPSYPPVSLFPVCSFSFRRIVTHKTMDASPLWLF